MAARNTKSGSRKSSGSGRGKGREANSPGQAFLRSTGGKLLLAALLAVIVILLNVLLSRNQLSGFFLITGIELLVAFAAILLVLAWQQRDVDRKD